MLNAPGRTTLVLSAASNMSVSGTAGINKQLRAKGIKEGDTVVIGETELQWSDDQSEGALYAAWREEKKRKGTAWHGSRSWPHAV